MTNPSGRIWFPGNPWPGGHALEEMNLWGTLVDPGYAPAKQCLYLHLFIRSTNYYDETPEVELEAMHDAEERLYKQGKSIDDWRAVGVWSNYHRCHIDTNEPYVLATEDKPFSLEDLDGFRWQPDQVDDPENNQDIMFDDQAFHCYILGHDAVGCHDIKFARCDGQTANIFDIDWRGRVAKAYVGDYAYRHKFKLEMRSVPFAGFQSRHHAEYLQNLPKHMHQKDENGHVIKHGWYDHTLDRSLDEREAQLRQCVEVLTNIPTDDLNFVAEKYADWLKF